MRQSDWKREVEYAAEWWTGQVSAAVAKAFPAGTIFHATGRNLATTERLDAFRTAIESEMNGHLNDMQNDGKGWDRSVPLRNANYRRFGKEGNFLSPVILRALKSSGFIDDIDTAVADAIPIGCQAVVNPGTVFMATDRRDRGETVRIQHRHPEAVMEQPGDGI